MTDPKAIETPINLVKYAKKIISDNAITAPGKAYVSETISLK